MPVGRDVANRAGAVSVGITDTPVLTANANRQQVIFSNDGANVIYLQLQLPPATSTTAISATAAVVGQGIRLAAAQMITLAGYTGAIRGIAVTGATNLSFVEI